MTSGSRESRPRSRWYTGAAASFGSGAAHNTRQPQRTDFVRANGKAAHKRVAQDHGLHDRQHGHHKLVCTREDSVTRRQTWRCASEALLWREPTEVSLVYWRCSQLRLGC
eukprot:3939555-Rhodomonas_salina.2